MFMMDDKSVDVIPRRGDALMMLQDVHNCAPTRFPTDAATSWVHWRTQHTQQRRHNVSHNLDILNDLGVNGASAAATTLSVSWHTRTASTRTDMSSTQNWVHLFDFIWFFLFYFRHWYMLWTRFLFGKKEFWINY